MWLAPFPFPLSLCLRFHLIMPGSQICPGCLKQFTSQKAHLSQTSSPLCRRLAKRHQSARSRSVCILQKRPSQLSKSQSLTPPHTPPPPTSPTPTPPASPQPTSPHLNVTSDTESSDDEEDFLTNETMPGWEPPAPHNNQIDSNPPSDTEPDPLLSSTPPEDIRQRTWVTPRVIQFPNPHAGEPIGSASPSHNAYATSLGNPSPSNPYSPFTLKVDWEVAQWAKLRGPSSTSIADLLKIDRV